MAFIENEETKTKQKYCLMYKKSKRKENVKYMGWRRLHRRVITILHGRLLHGPTDDGRETVFPPKHVFLHRVGLGLLRVLQLYVCFSQSDFGSTGRVSIGDLRQTEMEFERSLTRSQQSQ